jgi:hypothetical protein
VVRGALLAMFVILMNNGLRIHSIGKFLHCLLRTWHTAIAMVDGMRSLQHLHLSTVIKLTLTKSDDPQ